MQNLFDLTGRVIIITGGAGMLGEQYTHALTSAGASVVVCDTNAERAERVAATTQGHAGRAIAVPTDITQKSSVDSLVEKALSAFGKIDGLLNNAALDPKFDVGHDGKHGYTFEDYPVELWSASLSVNLTGMFLTTQAVAPAMLAQGRGIVINVSSMYGLVGPDQRLYERDTPDEPKKYKPIDYSVTKSAVLGFTRYLAAYWGDKGIRVNTLTLGGVNNQHDKEFTRRYHERTPLGRMADKAEYSGAVVFLFSDACTYMTGSNLIIDGGWTCW